MDAPGVDASTFGGDGHGAINRAVLIGRNTGFSVPMRPD